jgi:hypothetical protein
MSESDIQLQKYVDELVKNQMASGLVKYMKPLDVAGVVAKDLGLCPKDAVKVTIGLIKKSEGISGPNIETNKQFPVPAQQRNDPPLFDPEDLEDEMEKDDVEENVLARPSTKVDITPKFVVQKHQFPPDPHNKDDDWPYDDMTTAAMKPSTKSRKRPLNMSNDKGEKKKYIFKEKGKFDLDLRLGQAGGDGAGGAGLYQKGIHSKQNYMSTAGNRTWDRKGIPGWSKSPEGKEFDLPDDTKEGIDTKPANAGDEDDTPSFMKNPPVGSSIPTTNYGGRTPVTQRGYRVYRRK